MGVVEVTVDRGQEGASGGIPGKFDGTALVSGSGVQQQAVRGSGRGGSEAGAADGHCRDLQATPGTPW